MRSGARPGDEVFVTGTIGGAAVGLHSLRTRADSNVPNDPNDQKFLRPEPRVRAGVLLGRNRAASACIDLSDGLADGLRQIAGASGVDPDESPVPLRFKLALNNVPQPAIDNAQLALRARLSLGGVDASLGYGFLYDPFPAILVKAVAAEPLARCRRPMNRNLRTPTAADNGLQIRNRQSKIGTERNS
jgi:hypothetical protein